MTDFFFKNGENSDRDKFRVPLTESDSDLKFEIFESWLLENGAKFSKLELKNYGDEVRGCKSVYDIEEDEIIVEIPLNCVITVEMGKETDVGKELLKTNIDLDAPKHIYLMLFMLIDRKNPTSFFKPYYDILPATLHNMPIFWSEDEIDYLKGSYLQIQIDERKMAIESDYMAICSVVPEFESIATLEEFSWARMCVCSRNFGLTVNGLRTAALVPYADMLNHLRPRETKWQYDDLRNSFTIVSLHPIFSGSQVYDSYGQKCNHRFLLNYGFSIENNVEADGFCPNEVPILVQLEKSDPLYEKKCSFWSREGALPVRRIRIAISDSDSTRILIAMLRIVVADESDFEYITASYGAPYRSTRDMQNPLNLYNEMRSMQYLQHICEDYLSRYPSTLEEDLAQLADPEALPMFSNKRNAVIQVRGEKEILRFYKHFAIVAIQLLSIRLNATSEFDMALKQFKASEHPVLANYLCSTIPKLRQDENTRLDILQKRIDFSKPTVV